MATLPLGEIERLDEMLRAHVPFAFPRFGEGELRILHGYSLRKRDFIFVSGEPAYEVLREQLRESFTYVAEPYYIGISPEIDDDEPFGPDDYLRFRLESGQPADRILSACIFVDQNHRHFLHETVPLFAEYETVVVCSERARLEGLPFEVNHQIRGAAHNAWLVSPQVRDELRQLTEDRSGLLVILMLGPFSNILSHLGCVGNPRNTYLDVGSPLDLHLFGQPTRMYLQSAWATFHRGGTSAHDG